MPVSPRRQPPSVALRRPVAAAFVPAAGADLFPLLGRRSRGDCNSCNSSGSGAGGAAEPRRDASPPTPPICFSRRSEAARRRWQDPAYRAKMRAARRATALVAPRAWTSRHAGGRSRAAGSPGAAARNPGAAARNDKHASPTAAGKAAAELAEPAPPAEVAVVAPHVADAEVEAAVETAAAAEAVFVDQPVARRNRVDASGLMNRVDGGAGGAVAATHSASPAGSGSGHPGVAQEVMQQVHSVQRNVQLADDVRVHPPSSLGDESRSDSGNKDHLRDHRAVQGMLEEASELMTGVLQIGVGDSITTCNEEKAAAINQYVRRNKLRSEKLIMFHHDKQRWMDAKLRQGEDKRLLIHDQDLKRRRQLERQEEARKRHARVRARKEAETRSADQQLGLA